MAVFSSLTFSDPTRPSPVGTFFFHGFPGVRTQQNRDLAAALVESQGGSSHVFFYEGLGNSPGRFSFRESISQSREFVRQTAVKHGYQGVNLVGHSWGGFVCLNIAHKLGTLVRRTILLSPLVEAPGPLEARLIIESVQEDHPNLISVDRVPKLLEEIEALRVDPQLAELRRAIDPKTLAVIQARIDIETPAERTKLFLQTLGGHARYQELSQGHNFLENRAELFGSLRQGLEP